MKNAAHTTSSISNPETSEDETKTMSTEHNAIATFTAVATGAARCLTAWEEAAMSK
jgi:hypothetical protein